MPLILLAAICWAGATAAGLSTSKGGSLFVALGAAGVALLWRHWRANRAGGVEWPALILLSGAGLSCGEDVRRADARCLANARATHEWVVRVHDAAAPGAFVRASIVAAGCRVPVALAVRAGDAEAGSTVRVARAEPSVNDRGLLLRDAVLRVERRPGPLAQWRNRVAATLDRRFGTDAPIVRALLIADTHGLSPEIRERFADAGLVHILSISGLHVGIVGGALLLLFEALRLPGLSARVAAVAVTTLYVVAIGAPPPAVRSATLFAALALSRALQRPVSVWGSFALAALAPLVDPRTVLELGYQLSVSGYAAVVVAGRASRRLVPEAWAGWRSTLARDLLAGVLTTLATAPLVAWHFGRLSLVAPLSNLAAGPVVALLQPTLFLAMLLPVESAATLVADAARPQLVALQSVAAVASGLPGAAVPVAPSAWTALLTGLAVLALLVACWRRAWHAPLALSLACVAWIAWSPRAPISRSGQMEVHLLDVGQGDAVAVRTPAGRWVLVDAGRAWRAGDAGRSMIVPYLRRRGGPLELLVLSHPHADHIGGATSVIRALRPPDVRDAAFVEPSGVYLEMLRTLAHSGGRWQRARPGEQLELDGVRFEFLAPDSAWMQTLADPNEASVVLRVAFGEHSLLLTGDAERAAESWLLAHRPLALASTVLKVAHHGSSTSTTAQFLEAVTPRVALVSVGAGNTYGHPSSEVMRRLAEAGTTVLRTDQLGTVVLRTNGADLEVEAAGYRWLLARPLPRPAPDGHLSAGIP